MTPKTPKVKGQKQVQKVDVSTRRAYFPGKEPKIEVQQLKNQRTKGSADSIQTETNSILYKKVQEAYQEVSISDFRNWEPLFDIISNSLLKAVFERRDVKLIQEVLFDWVVLCNQAIFRLMKPEWCKNFINCYLGLSLRWKEECNKSWIKLEFLMGLLEAYKVPAYRFFKKIPEFKKEDKKEIICVWKIMENLCQGYLWVYFDIPLLKSEDRENKWIEKINITEAVIGLFMVKSTLVYGEFEKESARDLVKMNFELIKKGLIKLSREAEVQAVFDLIQISAIRSKIEFKSQKGYNEDKEQAGYFEDVFNWGMEERAEFLSKKFV